MDLTTVRGDTKPLFSGDITVLLTECSCSGTTVRLYRTEKTLTERGALSWQHSLKADKRLDTVGNGLDCVG